MEHEGEVREGPPDTSPGHTRATTASGTVERTGEQIAESSSEAEPPAPEPKLAAVPVRRRLSGFEILSKPDFKEVDIDVPEWGGFITFRSLSAQEALDFAKQIREDKNNLAPVRLLAKSLVDEKGDRLFTEEQITALAKKSMAVITRLQDVALELNGLGDKAKAAAEAAKNA